MKSKISSLLVGALFICGFLAGCGSDRPEAAATTPPAPPSGTTPPSSTTMDLDTAEVLAIAQYKTSESAAPFEVDNGAVAIIPAGDQTSPPLAVDAT